MGHEVMNYADGHLDAPGVGGFNAKEGFSQNSVEAQRSLDLAVERSNDLGVQLFAVSGDLFHSGNPSPEIVARAVERLRRLNAKWIVADGNHDQSGVPAGHRNALAAYLAEQPGCVGVYSEPAVHEFNGLYVAVLPWLKVSNSNLLGATNKALEENVERLAGLIPDGSPSIMIGHVTLAECTFDSGLRGSEVNMSTSTLEASIPTSKIDEGPWSVARFGHIHKRQQLSDKTGYTGSPYKVSFGETNDDKGVDLISIDGDQATVAFQRFDVRELIKIDLTKEDGAANSVSARPGDVVRLVADSDHLARAEALARAFVESGAQAHIHRIPDVMVAIAREAQYSTEMAPTEALSAYLVKKDVAEAKRPAIVNAFADVSASCQH